MIANTLITTIFNKVHQCFSQISFFFLYNIIFKASSSRLFIIEVTTDGIYLK